MTHAATQAGLILGTAAYMSPEQARGKTVSSAHRRHLGVRRRPVGDAHRPPTVRRRDRLGRHGRRAARQDRPRRPPRGDSGGHPPPAPPLPRAGPAQPSPRHRGRAHRDRAGDARDAGAGRRHGGPDRAGGGGDLPASAWPGCSPALRSSPRSSRSASRRGSRRRRRNGQRASACSRPRRARSRGTRRCRPTAARSPTSCCARTARPCCAPLVRLRREPRAGRHRGGAGAVLLTRRPPARLLRKGAPQASRPRLRRRPGDLRRRRLPRRGLVRGRRHRRHGELGVAAGPHLAWQRAPGAAHHARGGARRAESSLPLAAAGRQAPVYRDRRAGGARHLLVIARRAGAQAARRRRVARRLRRAGIHGLGPAGGARCAGVQHQARRAVRRAVSARRRHRRRQPEDRKVLVRNVLRSRGRVP